MLNQKQIDALSGVDINAIDKSRLADVGGVTLDNSLPKAQRMEKIIELTGGNPFCFRCGDMSIKVEFCEDAPPLQDIIARFLARHKEGGGA